MLSLIMAIRKKHGIYFYPDTKKLKQFLNYNYGGNILLISASSDIINMISDKQKVKFVNIDFSYKYDFNNFDECIGVILIWGSSNQINYVVNRVKNFDINIIVVADDVLFTNYISNGVYAVFLNENSVTQKDLYYMYIDTLIMVFNSNIFDGKNIYFDHSDNFLLYNSHCLFNNIMGLRYILKKEYPTIENFYLKKVWIYFLCDYYKCVISDSTKKDADYIIRLLQKFPDSKTFTDKFIYDYFKNIVKKLES